MNMNKQEVINKLYEKNLRYAVIYVESVDSTNNLAKEYDNPRNLLVIAETQTAGRGRYGRSFASPPGKNIYFTLKIVNPAGTNGARASNLLYKPPVQTQFAPSFFPLIAAVSVSRAVSSVCSIDLDVKWPNDLLYNRKKVCGILTEASVKDGDASCIIVGIGLNINSDITDFPAEIQNIASSLKIISGKEYSREDILCAIVGEFSELMQATSENLLEEYRKKLLLDVDITFDQNGKTLTGRAAGITSAGNLVARLKNGEEIIIQSGEIGIL